MEFRDQLGRKISLAKTPGRIVSLVPSQTELLIDLDLKEQLVGLTKFCVHPGNIRKIKKVVGGTKQVHFSRIAALEPDIILCNKEENTAEMVAELEKIAPVHVSDIYKIKDALELMWQYGEIFGKSDVAHKIIFKLQEKLQDFEKLVANRPPKRVAYFIWKDPLMVAGTNTFIDHLLELNNFKNIYSEPRYPVTTIEELQKRKPEVILLSSEPYPFREKHKSFFSQVGVKVKLIDGEYFSWYGTRLLDAFDYFRTLRV